MMVSMGMADEYVTQREFDQLRSELIRIDDHGTRGIGTIQAQLTEVVKDVTELKGEVNSRFAEHQRQHERELADRAVNRRWGIGVAVAMLGAVGGLYPYLHVVAHK